MAVTIRLRKTDFTTPATASTLALQRVHGSSNRTYWLKQALVSAGWVVYYSSDGITTGNTDLWTSSQFQAVLMQSYATAATNTATIDGVWTCLRSPEVDANGDYLHICLSPSQTQWANPAVRGPTNASSAYGVYNVVTASYTLSGEYTGLVRVGMALSPDLTAFSGGYPFIGTDTSTASGLLPVAPQVIWTTHSIGSGTGGSVIPYSKELMVLTEGNQFLVIQSGAGGPTVGNRNWWGLCALSSGGYGTVEQGFNISQIVPRGINLFGGRLANSANLSISYDILKQLGGWRMAYIKRVSGSIISGGLACPEPPDAEALLEDNIRTLSSDSIGRCHLTAISCSDASHTGLGTFSDLVMLSSVRINDHGRVFDPSGLVQWVPFKDNRAVLIKWDWADEHYSRITVTPPDSVV